MRAPRRARIATLEVFGTIGGSVQPSTYVPLIDAVRRSRRVRGLLLDVDSPGGAAAASAELHAAVRRLAETKPVVAYIRSAGASGAYYIASAANRIVAMPDAFVGSIGVEIAVQKSGRLKDMLQPWRAPTPEEEEKLQALLDEVYEGFIGAVARGRRLSEDQVRELATGEVFTARRADGLGLVDQLGDMEAALDVASELAGVPRRAPVQIRPRRPFLRRVFGGANEDLAARLVDEVESRLWGRVLMG
jgi:protease IV